MLRFALIGLVGCAGYSPGSFAYGTKTFPGTRATVGCLDVAIERRVDHDGAAVIGYQFANRCETKQVIDLGKVHVVGRDAAGGEHSLNPLDPAQEIRPLALDARLAGKEALAYPMERPMVQVCVDAASLVRERRGEKWMCFAHVVVVEPTPDDAITPSGRVEPPTEPNRTRIDQEGDLR